jgi:autoinducer 2-degrading protein
MFAVVVTFQIHPEQTVDFLAHMQANATTSKEAEPGCLQFDVCTDVARPNEVFLYEVYTDRAAFDAHLQSAHFKAFDSIAGPMIASKVIQTYAQVTR